MRFRLWLEGFPASTAILCNFDVSSNPGTMVVVVVVVVGREREARAPQLTSRS
jgi:hypothetical protein